MPRCRCGADPVQLQAVLASSGQPTDRLLTKPGRRTRRPLVDDAPRRFLALATHVTSVSPDQSSRRHRARMRADRAGSVRMRRLCRTRSASRRFCTSSMSVPRASESTARRWPSRDRVKSKRRRTPKCVEHGPRISPRTLSRSDHALRQNAARREPQRRASGASGPQRSERRNLE